MRQFLKEAAAIILVCVALGLILAFLAYLNGEDRHTVMLNAIGWPSILLFTRGLPLIAWMAHKMTRKAKNEEIDKIFA